MLHKTGEASPSSERSDMTSTRFSQGAARRGCRVFLQRLSRLIRRQRRQRVVIDGIDVSGFSRDVQELIAQTMFDGMKFQSFTGNGWKYLRHGEADTPDVREFMDVAETVRDNHRERCAKLLERQSEISIMKGLITTATNWPREYFDFPANKMKGFHFNHVAYDDVDFTETTATDAEEPPPFDAKTFEETKIALENEKNDSYRLGMKCWMAAELGRQRPRFQRNNEYVKWSADS